MQTQRFADRVVFVTGAGSGIGRATAGLFADEGAKVYAVDVDRDGLATTLAAIREKGGRADGRPCDVADMASVQASVDAAVAAFGGLDVLCNVAGIGGFKRFEELTEEDWNRTFAVNVTGMFHTVRAALPHLLADPVGCVVNVGSTSSLRGTAYASQYAASKAAVLNFTRSLALEFATRGLRANCIAPAGIQTELISHFIPREDFEQQLIAYYSPPKPGKLWKPDDMATSIAYLASDEARMINGAVLVCDGGTLA